MATKYIRYPASSGGGGGGSEQALTPNGGPLPADIKIVGGYDGTNCQVLSTDSAGYLNVNAAVTFPSSLTVDQAVAASLNATVYQGGNWTVTTTGNSVPLDIFGNAITSTRYNQLEIDFNTSPSTSLLTKTTANGGTITTTLGHTLFSTSTNANGQAKAVSVQLTTYRPGSELYAYFTASFTTGIANSYQRIGLYDVSNGFFIGYEGTVFGVTLRSGGSDTFTARSSWNGDPLDGSSTSKFTRAGVPEAINLTYSNVFRIRFGWLGSADILFEVLSPDEDWVVYNTIRMPNTQLNPSIQNPNLPITLDIKKTTAAATDLIMSTACWAAGSSTNVQPITTTLTDNSLATLTRSVITGYSSAGGGSYNNVKVTPSGSLTVAVGDITGIVGQQTMANSIPVAIASNQSSIPVAATQSGTWNINNISGTISLPTGAATESTLSTLNGKVPSNLTVTSTRLLVDGSGVTQPVSGTVTANQGGSWSVAATQSGNWSTRTQDGSGNAITSTLTMSNRGLDVNVLNNLNVAIVTSNTLNTNTVGKTVVTSARNVYSSTNVTTSAYTQLVASLGNTVNAVEIFDSSGQTLWLATGAAGSETNQIYIYPGGNGFIPFSIPVSTRVSIKAVSATANAGEITVVFYT